jgi:hypothetical protein
MASGITETEYVDKDCKVISEFCDKPSTAEKDSSLATNLLRLSEPQVRLLTPNVVEKKTTNIPTLFEPPENSML